VFVPSLALALGTLSGSGKAFEALYRGLDVSPDAESRGPRFRRPGARQPLYLYAPVAVGLLAVAALARRRQLQAA